MGQLRFGTDGVRGRVPDQLDAAYVSRLGRAAAEVLGAGPWLIGEDTRESSNVLAVAFADGLHAAGAEPQMAGVLPTPGLAAAGAALGLPAAMITASHNPWFDNGVKIFAPGGLKLTDDVEHSIEANLSDRPVASATSVAADVHHRALGLYVVDHFADHG